MTSPPGVFERTFRFVISVNRDHLVLLEELEECRGGVSTVLESGGINVRGSVIGEHHSRRNFRPMPIELFVTS